MPSKLLDSSNSEKVAGVWRNAYYLSTSIEETNIRKQPAKSMSNVEFPSSFQPLREGRDEGSPANTIAEGVANIQIDNQQSFFATAGGKSNSRPQSAITSSGNGVLP